MNFTGSLYRRYSSQGGHIAKQNRNGFEKELTHWLRQDNSQYRSEMAAMYPRTGYQTTAQNENGNRDTRPKFAGTHTLQYRWLL